MCDELGLLVVSYLLSSSAVIILLDSDIVVILVYLLWECRGDILKTNKVN